MHVQGTVCDLQSTQGYNIDLPVMKCRETVTVHLHLPDNQTTIWIDNQLLQSIKPSMQSQTHADSSSKALQAAMSPYSTQLIAIW